MDKQIINQSTIPVNPKMEDPKLQLFTVDEVAKLLRVHFSTVYEMIKKYEIPTVIIGRRKMIRKMDLERYIEEHLNR